MTVRLKVRTELTPRSNHEAARLRRMILPELKRLVVGEPIRIDELYLEIRDTLGGRRTAMLTTNDVIQAAWFYRYQLLDDAGKAVPAIHSERTAMIGRASE